MKLLTLIFLLLLAGAPARAQQQPGGEPSLERSAAAEPGVVVSLCLTSGDVVVRGWERAEVRVRADAGRLELQTDRAQPARRVEVSASVGEGGRSVPGACGSARGLELNVPRGATVSLRLHDGDLAVSDVAELTINKMSGDVDVRGVARSTEVSVMSGDVSLADSRGRARVRAVSGSVSAVNVTPLSPGDAFEATSTSGDVELEGVGHSRVSGSTISGGVRLAGQLAPGGAYEFKTISGDITLELPADASFRLNAKVMMSGEIVTDFPVRATSITSDDAPPAPPAPPTAQGRPGRPPRVHVEGPRPTQLVGTVGAGDAAVQLSSFSGTIHLKRR